MKTYLLLTKSAPLGLLPVSEEQRLTLEQKLVAALEGRVANAKNDRDRERASAQLRKYKRLLKQG